MQIQAENTASVAAETVEAKARLQMALDRIAKLEALLQEAAVELHTYIDAEYPSRLFYADEKRKHNRDMEIVFRIQSALEGGKDD